MAPTQTDDDRNINKLEEVLRRQRERLENISGAFRAQAPPTDLAESSNFDASPIGQSALKQSSGVYSTSTNNLEKAYEDLEREIIEIKQRLQNSAGSNIPQERLAASLRDPYNRPGTRNEREGSDHLAQSLGSNIVGPGSASAARRRGGLNSYNPLRSN